MKPDIMIEFRQPYIGPLMRKYGNMFRAGDSPNAAVENRVRIVDLRLLSGDTAVHSDMFMWHYDEPVEAAALQILNILFSVPQLSVRLEDIPPDHREMVTFYLDYWRRNRDVLLDGAFVPHAPLANYPRLDACTAEKCIVAIYQNLVVELASDSPDLIDVVNGKASEAVVLSSIADQGLYTGVALDARGREVARYEIRLGPTPARVDVPPSGLLALKKIERFTQKGRQLSGSDTQGSERP